MAQEHIQLGYLRDPESHEMYFPYTHYLGVIGLDTHVIDLIGGSVTNYIPLAGSSAITGSLTPSTNNSINLGDVSHIWKTVYAGAIHNGTISFSSNELSGTINGTSIQTAILSSTSVGNISLGTFYAPTSLGTAGQFLKVNSGATALDYGNIYSVNLKHVLNGASATVIGSIYRDTNSDLTLPTFYAPTTGGTSANQLLISQGTGTTFTATAPTWTNLTLTNSGLLKWNGSAWGMDTNSYLSRVQFDVRPSTDITESSL